MDPSRQVFDPGRVTHSYCEGILGLCQLPSSHGSGIPIVGALITHPRRQVVGRENARVDNAVVQ